MLVWQIYQTTIHTSVMGDMFQWTIDEIFKGLPNVYPITDILIVGYDTDGRNP